MHRIFHQQIPTEPDQTCRIEGDEAHHAVRVKRVREGDTVGLLDGAGTIAEALIDRVETTKRNSAIDLRLLRVRRRPPERPAVHVLSAAPKGGSLEQMIDQLSQVGAASWAPLRTERGERDPRSLDRLHRATIESAKQCGRAHLLEIRPAVDLDAALLLPAPVLVADAAGHAHPQGPLDEVTVLVGPEGGWSDDERTRIAASPARLTRFGPHVLRIETAAVVAAAILMKSPP